MSSNVAMKKLYRKELMVNGNRVHVIMEPEETLARVIREQLGLTGTKVGCDAGQCGVCSVILDGKVVRSCVVKMKNVPDSAKITTIEGIGTPTNLHPIQAAFVKHGAAQCGFCISGFIISSKALLDQNQSPTREEVRDWFQKHRNACRCTGYKPIVDAVMDAAKILRGEMKQEELFVDLKDGESILGTYYPRPSAVAKVTGTWDYGADLGLKLPKGTLRMALVQAKVSHANILSIDTSEAEKMPGVECVLTHKDVKGNNRINGLVTFPWNKGDGYDRPILCDEKVFQYGDAIAIVCADTTQNAKAAAEKVKVELEELPAYMNAYDAIEEDAIEIHPGTPNIYYEQPIIKGEDTKPIMEKAEHVVEGYYYSQRQPHLILEPDVGFAYFDEEGRLTIHSKSIALYIHIDMIYEGLGIEKEKIRLIQNNSGATFGYKMSPSNEALLGVACMATGKPVYLEFDMHQQIAYTGKRAPGHINLKMAADKDGKILGMEYDHMYDHGAYSEFGDLVAFKGIQFIGAGYDIKNIRGLGRAVCTNHTYGTAFRSFGSPQAFTASEILVDELAEEVGMDPFEFRYKNVYRPGATTPTGQAPEVYPFPEMFDFLRPKYQEALERAKKESTEDKKRGVGVSLGIYCVGGDFADIADVYVELMPDGGVTIFNTWQDHGQGSDMGTLTIAHETLKPLNMPLDKIKLDMNDTGKSPDSGCSAGSRGQVFIGGAIKDGCEKLLEAMKKEDGTYRTYDQMIAEGIPVKYTGNFASGHLCKMIDEKTAQCDPQIMYMYSVFLSEVEVDMNTGKTQVVKMTLATDCGKIINKLIVDGQMLGGLAQGVGLALSEDFVNPEKDKNLIQCGFPYIKDIPDEMEVHYFETPRKHGPYGASGVGEAPLTAPHASIVNAIYNACGVRIRELPALPEKVFAGIQKLKQEEAAATK